MRHSVRGGANLRGVSRCRSAAARRSQDYHPSPEQTVEVFDEPERFKIDRSPNPHLGLGFGIHFCLGAHLARLEGAITAQLLTQQFDTLTLVEPDTAVMGGLGGPKSVLIEVR